MSRPLKLAMAAILLAFAVAHVIGLRELQAAHPAPDVTEASFMLGGD
jgi:hypothetical protein